MGVFVIACYRPKPGKEALLQELMKEHLPILRREGFATDRTSHVMRGEDGVLIELFEWVSTEAIEQAHANPAIQALWERYGKACEYVPLASLPEAQKPFSNFEPLDTY